MASIWKRYILPAIVTILFSIFSILIALVLIRFSWFLKRELAHLIKQYGRDNIVKIFLQGNFKGLVDLFLLNRGKQTTSKLVTPHF
jgi:hypothetical protein